MGEEEEGSRGRAASRRAPGLWPATQDDNHFNATTMQVHATQLTT